MTDLPDDVWMEIKEYLIAPKKPETPHPNVHILNEWWWDYDTPRPLFRNLMYFGFYPLTKSGTNGRQIHNDYDDYWRPYIVYSDSDEE